MTPSEKDFREVAQAAILAKRRGDMEAASTLDIIARKFNAELSHRKQLRDFPNIPRVSSSWLSWKDIPSVLEEL